ncbi:hypothetical protein TYRP_022747, partial [Tyrophagus putrescentiae]
RLTLTTLGHCERPPTRALLAPLARPELGDVHSAQVSSDLAALGCALILFCTLSNGSPWSHLAYQKRPPTRTSLAPLARPSSAGVFGKPSDARPRRFYPCTANTLMTGPAAHPDVTPPRASLAALARPSSSDVDIGQVTSDLAALGSALLLTQILPFWAVLPPHQQCFPANSEQRQQRALRERQRERTVLSSAAAATIASRACAQLPKPAQHLPKQKTTFQTFWVFWSTIRF